MGIAMITRAIGRATIEANKRKRQVTAIWSSEDPDAHRTVFAMGGIDTKRFASNPVLLWEHGHSTERGGMPIANAVEFGPDTHKGGRVFVGTARFWDDEFSSKLFDRYESGQVRGWSINVQPRDASPPTREEVRARPELRDVEVVYREVELFEVSGTALPSNPSTLTLSVERSAPAIADSPCPKSRLEVQKLLRTCNALLRIRPDDKRMEFAVVQLGLVCRNWSNEVKREIRWAAAQAVLQVGAR